VRAIAEYQVDGRWLVALGAEDDTFATLCEWLMSHVDGCTAVRGRDEAVTDKNGAGFKGCCECGSMYWAKRNDSRFCGPTCRQRNSRARRAAIVASRMTSAAGHAPSSIADVDDADVAVPSDPRAVFGTFDATSCTTVKAPASLATRSGASSRTVTNHKGERR
jgi:hypothetical protein